MTQLHFTLDFKEIQSILQNSSLDQLNKKILLTTFNQLMEAQRDTYIGSNRYERDEARSSMRNGYYERDFVTISGKIRLRVPRTRDGKFSTDIFERYQRHEKALLSCMLEMYIGGVSTRKVSLIVETLCGATVSKSFVSKLTEQLDSIVNEWRNRPLDNGSYPYVMTDVLYLKIRENHHVVSKSCHIAVGITEEGTREILGFMIQVGESEDTWKTFFESLLKRGLKGVKLVISDAHKGLVKAIRETFVGSSWQRCQVHFERNIFTHIPKKNSEVFRNKLKNIFKVNDIQTARMLKDALLDEYGDSSIYAKACEILEDGFEDAFQYTLMPHCHYRLKSTNMLERLNEEIRRREKVIRIFPNDASAIRLIGALLMNTHEEWQGASRKYI